MHQFLPRDGPFDRVWKSVGRTRRRQDAKKDNLQIRWQHTATGSMRDSTCRFD